MKRLYWPAAHPRASEPDGLGEVFAERVTVGMTCDEDDATGTGRLCEAAE